jgi:site-specific DNA-methyltransferase (adenine-specific)
LLLISGLKGGRLLIPFAGSGTELIAGLNYGMSVEGYEINEEYFELAKKRLEHYLKTQKELLFH